MKKITKKEIRKIIGDAGGRIGKIYVRKEGGYWVVQYPSPINKFLLNEDWFTRKEEVVDFIYNLLNE